MADPQAQQLRKKKHPHVKRVNLYQFRPVEYLDLHDVCRPSTWIFTIKTPKGKIGVKFFGFFDGRGESEKLASEFKDAFFDVGFDENGRRQYVSCHQAVEFSKTNKDETLLILHEDTVDHKKRVFMSVYNYTNTAHYGFNMIDDLSFYSQDENEDHRMLVLSDLPSLNKEGSIQRGMPSNISLIVNCQDDNVKSSMYRVPHEDVVGVAIHKLAFGGDEDHMFKTLIDLNEQIWKSLQSGSVVVHCLAGVHRAASVVVSHYLYRLYVLRHHHISDNVDVLYGKLKAIRKGVEPLSYGKMINRYREFLQIDYPIEKRQSERNSMSRPSRSSRSSLERKRREKEKGDSWLGSVFKRLF